MGKEVMKTFYDKKLKDVAMVTAIPGDHDTIEIWFKRKNNKMKILYGKHAIENLGKISFNLYLKVIEWLKTIDIGVV